MMECSDTNANGIPHNKFVNSILRNDKQTAERICKFVDDRNYVFKCLGVTPIQLLCFLQDEHQAVDFLEMFIYNGFDVNSRAVVHDKACNLATAVSCGKIQIVDYLLRSGVDICVDPTNDYILVDIVLNSYANHKNAQLCLSMLDTLKNHLHYKLRINKDHNNSYSSISSITNRRIVPASPGVGGRSRNFLQPDKPESEHCKRLLSKIEDTIKYINLGNLHVEDARCGSVLSSDVDSNKENIVFTCRNSAIQNKFNCDSDDLASSTSTPFRYGRISSSTQIEDESQKKVFFSPKNRIKNNELFEAKRVKKINLVAEQLNPQKTVLEMARSINKKAEEAAPPSYFSYVKEHYFHVNNEQSKYENKDTQKNVSTQKELFLNRADEVMRSVVDTEKVFEFQYELEKELKNHFCDANIELNEKRNFFSFLLADPDLLAVYDKISNSKNFKLGEKIFHFARAVFFVGKSNRYEPNALLVDAKRQYLKDLVLSDCEKKIADLWNKDKSVYTLTFSDKCIETEASSISHCLVKVLNKNLLNEQNFGFFGDSSKFNNTNKNKSKIGVHFLVSAMTKYDAGMGHFIALTDI